MHGETIVFTDAYTGQEMYGRIGQVFCDKATVRIITKEEAGPNPRKIVMRVDPSIAKITNGTGIIK
jgi:hypothetical protein